MGKSSHPGQFTFEKISERERIHTIDLIAIVGISKTRRDIVSYVYSLTGGGKRLEVNHGSIYKAHPRWLLFDVVQKAVLRIHSEYTGIVQKIRIHIPCPELLRSFDGHSIAEGTLPKVRTIHVLLSSLKVEWSVDEIEPELIPDDVAEALRFEIARDRFEVLSTDEGRMTMPSDRVGGKFIKWNDRIVGRITPDGRYCSVRSRHHYCYKYHGWGVQKVILETLKREGVKEIEICILEPDKKRIRLVLSLDEFSRIGKVDILRKDDGVQLFVKEELWKKQTVNGYEKITDRVY